MYSSVHHESYQNQCEAQINYQLFNNNSYSIPHKHTFVNNLYATSICPNTHGRFPSSFGYTNRPEIKNQIEQQFYDRQMIINQQSHSFQPYVQRSNYNRSIKEKAYLPKVNQKPLKWAEKGSKLAVTGNIFEQREDWLILKKIPINKQNTVHIRFDDDGPYGNDETRCLLLSQLSSKKIKSLQCVFCNVDCKIYDRFPLIDGTVFTSPVSHNSKNSINIIVSSKSQFINAICLGCISGRESRVTCKMCDKPWENGQTLQIGTLYKYDVLASMPCCQQRLNCKNCCLPLSELKKGGLPFFSQYSERKECPRCLMQDFHFIKPVDSSFSVNKNL